MGWKNLIVRSNEIHSVSKAYVNIDNYIDTFVKPTQSANIVANETIMIQYSIKQVLKVFLQYKENYSSFIIEGFSYPRNPKNSVMNSGKGVCHV